jgi:transmembrane sensor
VTVDIADASVGTSSVSLTEQALQWLVDLHSGSPESPSWDAYQQWCKTSPEHQHAALMAERLWEGLGTASKRPVARPRRLRQLGLIIVLSLVGGFSWQAEQRGWMADQITGVDEHRVLTLADGSHLELAPRTRVDIDVEGKNRVLHLYTGELFVQVAPDAQRPFDLRAGNGVLRALGTGFDVRREGDQVKMVVTEHAVRVTLDDNSQFTDVEAGQALQYSPDGFTHPQPTDVAAATAWRRDKLVFHQQSLSEVLKQLSLYHPGVIWIRDASLRDLPVTGVVSTDDTEAQLKLLQHLLPLRVWQSRWLTVIERDDSQGE